MKVENNAVKKLSVSPVKWDIRRIKKKKKMEEKKLIKVENNAVKLSPVKSTKASEG